MCGGGGGGAPQENPAATPTVDGSASGSGLGSLLAGGGGNVQPQVLPQQQSSLAEQMSPEAQLADLQQQLNNPDNFIPGFTAQQQGLQSALQTKTDQLI